MLHRNVLPPFLVCHNPEDHTMKQFLWSVTVQPQINLQISVYQTLTDYLKLYSSRMEATSPWWLLNYVTKKRVALWTSEVGTWIHFKAGPAPLYAAFNPVIYLARTPRQRAVLNLRIILNVHDVLTFCDTSDILTVGLQKIQVFCDPWLTTVMKALQYFRTFNTNHPPEKTV